MFKGGGVASCVTAWALTNDPDWRTKYDITIYQQGWRLGGKGASGRNKHYGDRIEEHGLHVWFGMYKNAFKMIQSVYAELGRPQGAPLRNWTDAFKPQNTVWLMDKVQGQRKPWMFSMAEKSGDPSQVDENFDIENVIETAFVFLKKWMHMVQVELRGQNKKYPIRMVNNTIAGIILDVHKKLPALKRFFALQVRYKSKGSLSFHQMVTEIKGQIDGVLPYIDSYLNTNLRHTYIVCDMGLAIIRGMVSDGIFSDQDFTKINNIEFGDWLVKHGANPSVTIPSGLVETIYDVTFSYEHGDPEKPNIEAGTALHAIILIMTAYKGSFIYKMQVSGTININPHTKMSPLLRGPA